MARKAVRSPHHRSLAHRTGRPSAPPLSPHRNGRPRPATNGRTLDPPPLTLGRSRTARTDLPWYAKELRRHGQRAYGWAFAVVTASRNTRDAFRLFRRFAVTTWLVAVLGCASLAVLPTTPVAVGGTAIVLLICALVFAMLGDDERRTHGLTQTTTQLLCLAALAEVSAIALAIVLWLLVGPLADLTIRLFGLWGIVVYFAAIIGVVLTVVPIVLSLLVAAARSFHWYRSELIIFPLVPFLLLFLATLIRLGLS